MNTETLEKMRTLRLNVDLGSSSSSLGIAQASLTLRPLHSSVRHVRSL